MSIPNPTNHFSHFLFFSLFRLLRFHRSFSALLFFLSHTHSATSRENPPWIAAIKDEKKKEKLSLNSRVPLLLIKAVLLVALANVVMRFRNRRIKLLSWFSIIFVVTSFLYTIVNFSIVHYIVTELSGSSIITAQYGAPSEAISIREIVKLPDQTLVFLNYPPSSPRFTKSDLLCVYFAPNSSQPQSQKQLLNIDTRYPNALLVRCPRLPNGLQLSIAFKSDGTLASGGTHIYKWNSLVYDAMIDRDNTTVVFVKGLNLRPGRLADASKYECMYGWDFRKPKKFLLRSEAISVAQEIVRCKTPLIVLTSQRNVKENPIKVSVKVQGKGTFPSIARPGLHVNADPISPKEHELCVCTMLRDQARFMREWVMYHSYIGVQRWFIYDNNSEDDMDDVILDLQKVKYNVTRHTWPWVKTQEAGFAHCAMRARAVCEWVGFVDVDEFLNLRSNLTLPEILRNPSALDNTSYVGRVGELRAKCYSFGPSGLRHVPPKGVMVGYTCRLLPPERHKSIVKPEALNWSLLNVVHHFDLKDGYEHFEIPKRVMVINHYKYQVWEVFKKKFQRRVATYVADWKKEQNVESKDRAPGLGTQPVEPSNWSTRFCDVIDTNLRNWVLKRLVDNRTHMLPWQTGNGKRTKWKLKKIRKDILSPRI